jgi:hypothetical protein
MLGIRSTVRLENHRQSGKGSQRLHNVQEVTGVGHDMFIVHLLARRCEIVLTESVELHLSDFGFIVDNQKSSVSPVENQGTVLQRAPSGWKTRRLSGSFPKSDGQCL